MRLFEPDDNIGAFVPLVFLLRHPADLPMDVLVEYSWNGAPYAVATAAVSCDQLQALPASRHTIDYRFVWNAGADVGTGLSGQVTLRLTATDANGASAQATSQPIGIDTTPAPAVPVTTPEPPVLPLAIAIESGDGQHGAARHWLRDPLVVRVRDAAQQPLVGAHVVFWVSTPPPAPPVTLPVTADIEEDGLYSSTTGAAGIAAVRVRPHVAGSLRIGAAVAGVPGPIVEFGLQVSEARIVAAAHNPAGPLLFGNPRAYEFQLEADGNPATLDIAVDLAPRLRLEVTGGQASDSLRSAAGPLSASLAAGAHFDVVPTIPSGVLTLRVSVEDDPQTAPLVLALPVHNPPRARRLAAVQPQRRYDDVELRLEAVSGGGTLVGYPGLTLAVPLQVRLVDAAGTQYTQEVSTGLQGCSPPGLQALRLEWRTSHGVLATTPSRGTDTLLTVAHDVPVYFTPTLDADWQIDVRVVGAVADPLARTFNWTDASGQPRCDRDNLLAGMTPARSFLVQPARDFGLVDANGWVESVEPGTVLRVAARGLSPYAFDAARPPKPVQLAALLRQGSAPLAVSGAMAPFAQDVELSPDGPGALASAPLLVIAGHPTITTATPLRQMVLFDAWLDARAEPLSGRLPTARRMRTRRWLHREASLQEAPLGMSPADGYLDSVRLASGELMLGTVDLRVRSRAHDLAAERIWRGHLDGDGAFGRGWMIGYDARVDPSWPGRVRWLDSLGLLHDFVADRTPKGLHVELRRNTSVSSDQGAFVIVDAFGREMHFDVCGSPQFVTDRDGNRLRFEHDEHARLVAVHDPIDRTLRIEHYTAADAVPEVLHGLVKRIVDPAQHAIDYTYYTDPADPYGRPGWLMRCTWPEAPTRVGQQDLAAYRRSETYRYLESNDARLDGQLTEVLDSEGTSLLVVEYTPLARVHRQTWNGGSATFEYPSVRERVVTDRDGNRRTWTFQSSPHVDAATAIRLVEHARGVRPGLTDRQTDFEHNTDGAPLALTLAGGVRHEWVYNDGATSPVQRGLLLAFTERSASGVARSWTWSYSPRWNLPLQMVPPEGRAPGATPAMHAVRYRYDPLNGRLVRVTDARVLNAVMVRNAAGRDELRWLHENPTLEIAYNAHGLPVRIQDERGIVTQLAYHPKTSPGASTSFGPGEGGWLAQIIGDAEATTAREARFSGLPLARRTGLLTHDPRGDLASVTSASGATHRFEHDALRECTSLTLDANGVARRWQCHLDPRGWPLEVAREQAGAPALAGGDRAAVRAERDAEGRITTLTTPLEQGVTATGQLAYTPEGRPRRVTSADALRGRWPDLVAEVRYDERNLPLDQTQAAGSPAEQRVQWSFTDRDAPARVEDAAQGPVLLLHDEFGIVRGGVDASGLEESVVPDPPTGNVHRAVRQLAGPAPTPQGFSERRLDELARTRRLHRALLGATAGGPFPVPVPRDYMPGPGPWPPVTTSSVQDRGAWGGGDGRTTVDLLPDARDALTRLVADDNYRLWLRRGTDGRVVAAGDNSGLALRAGYTAAGWLETAEASCTSTDPLAPLTLAPQLKVDRDGTGRPRRLLCTNGAAFGASYQSHGRVVELTDASAPDSSEQFNGHPVNAAGNVTRLHVDAANRVRRIETELTQDGLGGSPRQVNPFNSHARLALEVDYADDGRPLQVRDGAGRAYEVRYDNAGRYVGLKYPASAQVPSGAQPEVGYDGAGRVATAVDANGTRFRIVYSDNANRPWLVEEMRVEQPGPGVIGTSGYRFVYDSYDRVVLATEIDTGRAVELDHDSLGHVLRERQNPEIQRVYDGARLLRVQYPGGRTVVFHYDSDDPNRPRRIEIEGEGDLASYHYVGCYALRSRTSGPLLTRLDYRADQRIKQITITGLSAGATLQFVTELDKPGRFVRLSRTLGGATESWDWRRDSAGRIVSEDARSARQPQRRETVRIFDADSVCREQQVYTAFASDGTALPPTLEIAQDAEERGRVTVRRLRGGSAPQTIGLIWDASGKLRQDDRCRYAYDAFGRLARVDEIGSGSFAEYRCDAFGRRYHARYHIEGAVPVDFEQQLIWDGRRLVQVWQSGRLVEQYFWGRAEDELVRAEIDAGGITQRFHVVQRPDGYIDCVVDDQGGIVETYDYDLDGELTVLDPTRQPLAGPWNGFAGFSLTSPRQRLVFLARPRDPVTGLMDFGQRVYNPRHATFLQPDAGGVTLNGNAYALALHDPPTMLVPWEFPRAIELVQAALEGGGIDAASFARSLAVGVAVGLLIIGAAALLIATGGTTAPFLATVGVAALGFTTGVAAGLRMTDSGQSIHGALAGGAMDATMVTDLSQGLFEYDLGSMTPVSLTPEERGARLGGVVGGLLTAPAGNRLLPAACRYRLARQMEAIEARVAARRNLRQWVRGSRENDELSVCSEAEGYFALRYSLRDAMGGGNGAEFGLFRHRRTGRLVVRRGSPRDVYRPDPAEDFEILAHTHLPDDDLFRRYLLPAPQDFRLVSGVNQRDPTSLLLSWRRGRGVVQTEFGFTEAGRMFLRPQHMADLDEVVKLARALDCGELAGDRLLFKCFWADWITDAPVRHAIGWRDYRYLFSWKRPSSYRPEEMNALHVLDER